MQPSDQVVRAITRDGSFRVIAAVTTQTAWGVVAAQRASDPTARALGELVTGAILVRETMAPDRRVQVVLSAGGGQLVADAHPDGRTRGLVRAPEGGALDLSSGGSLRVMRSMPNGRIHEGIVAVAPGADVSEALMVYLQQSEQVVATLGVFATPAGAGPATAGGYVVQLLPEVDRGPLFVMTARLEELRLAELVGPATSARELLDELLFGMEHTQLDSSEVRFGCTCSFEKVVAGLTTLGQAEIRDIVVRGEKLDVECDYCREAYEVDAATMATLLVGRPEA